MISKKIRNTGIELVGSVPWGTHISYFYYDKTDLYNHLIPYFREGLRNYECCIWVLSKGVNVEEVINLLTNEIEHYKAYLKKGQFKFVNYKEIFYDNNNINTENALKKFLNHYHNIIQDGYEGVRVSYDSGWIKRKEVPQLVNYEIQLNNIIKDYQIMVMGHYPINRYNKYEILDIASSHQFVLFNKNGDLKIIQNYEMKRAEEEKKLFSLLSKGVAHNLKKFLSLIKGYSDLAQLKVGKNSEVCTYLKEISRSVNNFENLIGDFVKLGHNEDNTNFSEINVNTIIQRLLDMLTHLITQNIRIITNLEPNLWKINGNDIKIEQCVMNLVLNAKDAMPKGGMLTISTENIVIKNEDVEKIPNSRPGRFIRISIKDDGVGISKDTLKKLFCPFFTTKTTEKGTGLGLSISQIYVIQHDGWIHVKSEFGKGSQFDIYLPIQKSH